MKFGLFCKETHNCLYCELIIIISKMDLQHISDEIFLNLEGWTPINWAAKKGNFPETCSFLQFRSRPPSTASPASSPALSSSPTLATWQRLRTKPLTQWQIKVIAQPQETFVKVVSGEIKRKSKYSCRPWPGV